MSVEVTIFLLAMCFILEGFFSGSEIALVSADRMKLKSDSENEKWAQNWRYNYWRNRHGPWGPVWWVPTYARLPPPRWPPIC